MSKKILHIITTLDLGGAEKQLFEMVRASNSEYIQEVVWLKGDGALKKKFAEHNVRCLPLKSAIKHWLNSMNVFKLKSFSTNTILHAHLPRSEILASALSFVFGFELVISKHNAERMWPKGPKKLSKILADFVYWRAKRVVCISGAVKRFLIENGELKDESLKCVIVHYGIPNSSTFKATDSKELSHDSEKVFKIGTLARLEPQKDLKTLIHAAAVLRDKGVKVHFQVHGEGSERKRLQSAIDNLDLGDYVNLGAKLDNIENFLSELDLFVLPSLYEGFGLVVLEAAQNNLPVLLSQTEAAVEIVGEDRELIFPVGDFSKLAKKIEVLISNPKKLELLRVSTALLLSRFDIKHTVDQMAKIYES